jgi:hypothetical protein
MGLSLIAEVMGWPGDQAEATQEYAWLRMMSSVKYDGYSFFRAGVRFIETLATWLKQFEPADRAVAYTFVKRRPPAKRGRPHNRLRINFAGGDLFDSFHFAKIQNRRAFATND